LPAWNFGPAEQEFAEAALDPTRWVQALTAMAEMVAEIAHLGCYPAHPRP